MTDEEIACIAIGALVFLSRPIIGLIGIILEKRAERAERRRWQEACTPKPAPRHPRKIGIYSKDGQLVGSITLQDPEIAESRELMRKWEEMQRGTTPAQNGYHAVTENKNIEL